MSPISKEQFIDALIQHNRTALESIPKCDLHNHAGRGGKLAYIEGSQEICPPSKFASIYDMDHWLSEAVFPLLPAGKLNYMKRIEGTLRAAAEDNVRILAANFGVFEPEQYGGIESFSYLIQTMAIHFSPNTHIVPYASIREFVDIGYLQDLLSANWFKGVDIINYDGKLSDNDIRKISEVAHAKHLNVRAHVGEYGTAEEVEYALLHYELDEIQHGIQIANSKRIMRRIAEMGIPLHVCPASNIGLGLCRDYRSHPLGILHRNNVRVTINTDDLLVFGSSLTQQYLSLYESGNPDITADDLYDIYSNSASIYSV